MHTNHTLSFLSIFLVAKFARLVDDSAVDESMSPSARLLQMCDINEDIVEKMESLSKCTSSTLSAYMASVQDYTPLLTKLHKFVEKKRVGESTEESDIDQVIKDAHSIDDNIVAAVGSVKDENGTSYVANLGEPVSKTVTNCQETNYGPKEDEGYKSTVPGKISKGNKCDPEQPCLSQITRALPRNLSNGAGADPSLVDNSFLQKNLIVDACSTVMHKEQYEDGTEPAAFIEQSGAEDEAGYYLPSACKITVQSAITYLVTGQPMFLTVWSRNAIDKVHDKDAPRVTSLIARPCRQKHPEYMSDAEKFIQSRNQFPQLNKSLTATYSSGGLLTPSIGDVCEYKSGLKNWTLEDYINQVQSEHRASSFGGASTAIIRGESINFIREYTSLNSAGGTALEVYQSALSELRSISETHAGSLGLQGYSMAMCAGAELENINIDNAISLLQSHKMKHDDHNFQLYAQKRVEEKTGTKVEAKDANKESFNLGVNPLQESYLKKCQAKGITHDKDGNEVTAKNAQSTWMSTNNNIMKNSAVVAAVIQSSKKLSITPSKIAHPRRKR